MTNRLVISGFLLAIGTGLAPASPLAARNPSRPRAERIAGKGMAAGPAVPGPAFGGLTSVDVKAPHFPKPGASVSGTTWINSPPLTMAQLRGKVVLIDVWEYTCINCVRTFAQTKRWYTRYHKYGFDVIGVHDPEFDFIYKVSNVRAAVKRFGLPYPIVADDWYTIWKAYKSESWPNRYLIGPNGHIRYERSGEGADREFEQAIRYLLVHAHPGLKFPASYTLPPEENNMAPGCGGLTTREMFVGPMYHYGNVENPHPYHPGVTASYKMPKRIRDGGIGLSGEWMTDPNGMIFEGKSRQPGRRAERLRMRYHAAQLYAVINLRDVQPERIYILQDEKYLTAKNKGVDVKLDKHGRSYIEVSAPRMYYLVANPSMSQHVVDLVPTAPGVMIDSFTFGNNCQLKFPHL
jgi:peroxiredoxin